MLSSLGCIPLHGLHLEASLLDLCNFLFNALFWKLRNWRIARDIIDDHWTRYSFNREPLFAVSARTLTDLFLQVIALPPGSEVLCSAIQIPDMAKILRLHNLKVVAVEVNYESLGMDIDDLRAKISEKTKLILVAQVYGRYNNIDEIIRIASENKLMVIEDIAEAFSGFQRIGHPQADLALFSFGQIKHLTATTGGLALIRNSKVASMMREKQSSYKNQSLGVVWKKLFTSFLFYFSGIRVIAWLLVQTVRLGFDYRTHVTPLVRFSLCLQNLLFS